MIVDFPERLDAIQPMEIYEPVGRCIYCTHDKVRLYPEHIIPFGISGDALVLPEASCKKCGDMTGKFEQQILRNNWWTFRAHIGAPTYRPKQRPHTFTLRQGTRKEGQIQLTDQKQVQISDFPRNLTMVRLRLPGILVGRPATDLIEGELWNGHVKEDIRKYVQADQEVVGLGQLNTGSFCRMLAKIAHAYATAKIGYGNFAPYLRKLVKGKSITPTFWVGGDWTIPPPLSGVLHQISYEVVPVNSKNLVVVKLRLFAFFGTPYYRIVVGEI